MATTRMWLWLLAVGAAVAATAQADGISASSLAGLTPDTIGSIVVTTLQDGLPVGTRRLVVMEDLPDVATSNAPRICNGTPAVVAHTPSLGGNGECWKKSIMPALKSNLSCTCLNYLNATPTEWTIRFRPLETSGEVQLPPSLDTAEIIEVDSSMIYGLAQSVKTLNLIGVGDKPLPLQLRKSPIPGTVTNDFALIISTSTATIQTLRVENVDLSSYELKRGFVPSRLTNLTMTNCNLPGFPTDLLANMGKLEYIDLTNNSLMGVYQDITKDTCVAAFCPIKAMNLSNNNIKILPTYLMNMDHLESLSLLNNPIVNYSLGSDVYSSLKRLKVLELDSIQNCSVGEKLPVVNSSVCVYNITTEAAPETSAPTVDSGGGSNSYLMYIVIGGCLIIAVLVFVLVKRNACRSDDDSDASKEPLDAYFDNTLAFDETHPTVSASLLNDPIIITNRIPHSDLRIANCISKGGFGLVYSGVYNRRRVAIKKIRPDRAGDIKQIESFLKEICLMATLNHPRIVEFVGVSWDSLRNLCAVTEFMERGDLREVLHGFKLRNTPLTWESNKTAIALHIAEGLTYLHSLSPKVIHRDLKSKNVLLNGEMTAKLSDFGISREFDIDVTHMTAGIGTSFWIAPEVLLGKDYDEHADIFSFGVVLSEIDTDDYPYWNASNAESGGRVEQNVILQLVASGSLRPSFSDTCPQQILELAEMCLQVDPNQRPTAAEVAYELQRMIATLPPHSSSGFSSSSYY